jgi:hypothetical protein
MSSRALSFATGLLLVAGALAACEISLAMSVVSRA